MTLTTIEQKLIELRQGFDQSFARAAGGPQPAELDFVAIIVAGDAYAIRLSEVQSLHVDRALVPAPSLLPELLGVCGFRSLLTPVYDLAQLLGYRAGSSARWLVLARHPSPIAFAFSDFSAHLRVPLESVSSSEVTSSGVAVGGAVHSQGIARPVLRLPSLVETIAGRIKALRPSQER